MLLHSSWTTLVALLLVSITVTVGTYVVNRPQFAVGGTLSNGGKIWALLVAGSSGYFNYRHQADVCHAYQLLVKNGIPRNQIIVMMYDDVATSPENPTPNVIINRPGGPNVYKGVSIDYSGDDVNSTNFLAVLTGQRDAVADIGSGRVIDSGPDDHIFINFVDHGAPGYLCFPNDELHANDLRTTLTTMFAENRFNKMVWYVEACESGSMFDDILPENINTFVMTAADPRESSFACYFDKLRGTYLGDVFSVKWMEDSDVENLDQETLHHQFQRVRSETNTSHVEEYGDLGIGSLPVASFQGSKGFASGGFKPDKVPIKDAVSSRNVPLEILRKQYEGATDQKSRRLTQFKIRRLQKLRRYVDVAVSDIASQIAAGDSQKTAYLLETQNKLSLSILQCYEDIVKYFSKTCFKISENQYTLTKMNVFINVCSVSWTNSTNAMKAMDVICVNKMYLTGIQ